MIDYGVINMLSKELDIKTLRNELISSNIANIDTPGFKGKDLDFKSVLTESINDINGYGCCCRFYNMVDFYTIKPMVYVN